LALNKAQINNSHIHITHKHLITSNDLDGH